ncbi:Hypothetical protein FKW44_018091 [Caligus rogercresseyi]|uniref:Uncharacterized protein n=1 Tax=Caligus rogercresseyi TaxID=217165 RepID=A0A7T8GTX0_CALRO|nr:Hypothetical protein FKW44_018091 [Caligus rogercresseyi]
MGAFFELNKEKKKDWLLAVHPESKCAFQADFVLTKVIGMIYAARSRNRPMPTHMASIIYREVEALLQVRVPK